MAGGHKYTLTDLSTRADIHTVSSRSRIFNESFDETPPQNPFIDQTESLAHNLPAHPYNPGAGNSLLSNENQHHPGDSHTFLRAWATEWAAWLVTAMSLIVLMTLFSLYNDEPLRH